ncbi:hypothetical protein MD484_g2219, partial [Candolleomyces efflorescens]
MATLLQGIRRHPLPLLALLLLWSLSTVVTADKTFNIVNGCPSAITVYVNGDSRGSVAAGATIVNTVADDWTGFVYSNVNAPEGNTGAGTTKAGFVNQAGYYLIIKDQSNFNTGVSIVPSVSASNGLCPRVTCNSRFCANTYTEMPSSFPEPSGNAPAPPLYSCSTGSFTVRFCPNGAFPRSDDAVAIHPKGNTGKCLDARGGAAANGTVVQVYDCNGGNAQRWTLRPGDTQVELAGTGFCLDASSSPGNRTPMKLWKCISGLRAQTWNYNARSQLTLATLGQCLDLTRGDLANRNTVQTFQCSNGNSNQVWTVT